MSNSVFKRVAGLHPGMSVFDLSYTKLLTCDMGQLIPVMCDEVVPGDIFKIGNQSVTRMQPLVAPVLHEINQYVHYFFVPYRLLWDGWEDFITGGEDGNDASVLPRWSPAVAPAVGSLWDYFGFNTGYIPTDTSAPIAFPRNAYNLVWNEYYCDENLQAERPLDADSVAIRNWEKDYFTSSLPWQQRGTAPALPISGITKAVWPANGTGTGCRCRLYIMGRGNHMIRQLRVCWRTTLSTCLLLPLSMLLISGWRFRFRNGWSVMLGLVLVIPSLCRLISACPLVTSVFSVRSISEARKLP